MGATASILASVQSESRTLGTTKPRKSRKKPGILPVSALPATAPATRARPAAADCRVERTAPRRRPAAAPPIDEVVTRLAPGCAGDHPVVHHLLAAIFQNPTRDAFYSSLDDPFYEPRDRLLVKRAEQTVSHLLLTKRVMQLGSLSFPVDCVSWLGTLPEFRGLGYARRLVAAADETMRGEGAAIGLLKTRIPHFFAGFGWALCGRHSQAQAGSRDLLAQLSAHGLVPGKASVSIRPWRQVELPALMRLYGEMTANRAGHFDRTEAYWRWLVSRKSFDRIYVAVDGPDNFELEDNPAKIVGYVIIAEDRVLELAVAASHRHVARELLARACSEAIERDYHMVTLHAPPDDALFDIFRIAGGTLQTAESNQGEVQMARLLNPAAFLKSLCPELHRRAEQAGLTGPCELGILVGREKYRLVVTRRSVKLGRHKIGRSYLTCNSANFTRLLLGHFDVSTAIAEERLRASTQLAVETARVLFPQLPLWRPPLDELST